MNKIITSIKNQLLDINEYSRIHQPYNYFIMLFLVVIIKIFLILQSSGDIFISPFENSVWVFMILWLILRLFHSFWLLDGYYALASVFLLPYIVLEGNPSYWLYLSVSIVVFFKLIEFRELFVKGDLNE